MLNKLKTKLSDPCALKINQRYIVSFVFKKTTEN